ncbi:MAG: response regulator [Gluconacetobacter diazotrophicus]|nr:response regulator [Gluconacetobacter diazotrophicus]
MPLPRSYVRYAVAVASVGASIALKLAFEPAVGQERPLFLVFFAAVLFSGWYGGMGPSLLATGLSAGVSLLYFYTPRLAPFSHTLAQYTTISIFVLEGIVVSIFSGRGRRQRERLATALTGSKLEREELAAAALEERARLTRLEGDIGRALTRQGSLHDLLQASAEALVAHAGAAFARVWTYNVATQTLELAVSAGLYTHLDGPHSRVPLGKFKIGLIGSEQQPHLTNQVVGDPRVGDQEWARRERMVAFAGYPLLVNGELHGVLAMFSRGKLSDATFSALALVANTVALAIRQRLADAERDRLLAETRAARDSAEASSRAKDEFIATVSHELRTPLNAILGWARLLGSDGSDPELAREAVSVIERNAVAQSRLVEDLLDVSRIISGKLRLNLRTVDLPEVVRAAVQSALPAAEVKALRVDTLIDPGAGPVSGDADRLQQVVWNLVSNAVKFTPKGGRVQVRLARVASQVELVVSDTGKGITPDFLPHVFERFTQADASSTRQHAGLGLGLGITRHLVELHGGTVSVYSDGEGRGATFVVSLPIMVMHAAAVGTPERAHPTVPVGEGQGFQLDGELAGVRVVAVDDDADARKLLGAVLTRCLASVTVVASAAEALEAVRRERPDVLLSDVEMPGEDGYTLIGKVRALPAGEGGSTPAAALTAYARMEDRTRALRAGFQMHVPKPVDPAELVAVVANLAARSKA